MSTITNPIEGNPQISAVTVAAFLKSLNTKGRLKATITDFTLAVGIIEGVTVGNTVGDADGDSVLAIGA
jgi:hypothetical protein